MALANCRRLKDCDVTWLYGPMKAYGRGDDTPTTLNTSPPPSQLETPTGYPDRKPILKKKTASEMILQRSLLQHTLLQHAGAILKAQEADNGQSRSTSSPASSLGRLTGQKTASLDRTPPYTSSSLSSPSEGRHIHFNNEVSQCIAVEAKDGEGEHGEWPGTFDDGDFINDSIAMEQDFPEAACDSRSPSRSCNENRTIAPLPSTTLKYRGDTPEPPAGSLLDRWYHNYSTSSPSPWPSVETLRPSQSSHSLRLDDADHHDSRSSWQRHPRHAYPSHRSSSWLGESEDEFDIDQDLTSGDALPYEDGDFSDTGVFDKMVDAVNTAKDIAHVIWNVGWRR